MNDKRRRIKRMNTLANDANKKIIEAGSGTGILSTYLA